MKKIIKNIKKIIKYVSRIALGRIVLFCFVCACMLFFTPSRSCMADQAALYCVVAAIPFLILFYGVWYITNDW